jgi:hypothetical protein
VEAIGIVAEVVTPEPFHVGLGCHGVKTWADRGSLLGAG